MIEKTGTYSRSANQGIEPETPSIKARIKLACLIGRYVSDLYFADMNAANGLPPAGGIPSREAQSLKAFFYGIDDELCALIDNAAEPERRNRLPSVWNEDEGFNPLLRRFSGSLTQAPRHG